MRYVYNLILLDMKAIITAYYIDCALTVSGILALTVIAAVCVRIGHMASNGTLFTF